MAETRYLKTISSKHRGRCHTHGIVRASVGDSVSIVSRATLWIETHDEMLCLAIALATSGADISSLRPVWRHVPKQLERQYIATRVTKARPKKSRSRKELRGTKMRLPD
jgi:hypothetical protein